MSLSLAACGSSGDSGNSGSSGGTTEQSVTLHMGGGLTASSPQYESWQEFAAAVEEQTNGTVKISLDLSGALGDAIPPFYAPGQGGVHRAYTGQIMEAYT